MDPTIRHSNPLQDRPAPRGGPIVKMAYALHAFRTKRLSNPGWPTDESNPIRIVCTSDTHNRTPDTMPLGDILIHGGDLTYRGSAEEIHATLSWLDALPHPHKIYIAGNHDLALDPAISSSVCVSEADPENFLSAYPSLTYLLDSSTTINVRGRSVKIYGSPRTPKLGKGAFFYPRNTPVAESPFRQLQGHFDVEENEAGGDTLAILVTHGPPKGHLDRVARNGSSAGCQLLSDAIWGLKRKPALHVFGHIHEGHGTEVVVWDAFQRAFETLARCDEVHNVGRQVMLLGRLCAGFMGGGGVSQRTIMVNAAMARRGEPENFNESIVVTL